MAKGVKAIGVLGAIEHEIRSILQGMSDVDVQTHGGRQVYEGHFAGKDVVLMAVGCGKVATAAAVATLAVKYPVSELLFLGVAGAVAESLEIGDAVVATRLVQHDFDARPFFRRHELPTLKEIFLKTDPGLTARLLSAAQRAATSDGRKVVSGDVASGDQFLASLEQAQELRERLPGLLAVEMEGAALAQVCHEFKIPFGVLRVVSDRVGHKMGHRFHTFVAEKASPFCAATLAHYLNALES